MIRSQNCLRPNALTATTQSGQTTALISGVITEYFQHENIEQNIGSKNDYVSLNSNRIKTLIRNLLGNAHPPHTGQLATSYHQ
jgi:hypothetical protein